MSGGADAGGGTDVGDGAQPRVLQGRWGPGDRSALIPVDGGVTAAGGVRAGGVTAGLKPSGRPDLALVACDEMASAAVVTTTNPVKAAPCVVTEQHAADGRALAVLLNAGNANACTGAAGLDHARTSATAVADALGCEPTQVLVASTGIIGVPLDVDRVLAGVPAVVADLDAAGGARAAEAICTTDTIRKEVAVRIDDHAGSCVVGGMAKGAGMIEPSMATLLAVVTTDAPVSPAVLRPMVRQAVARTFNRISIDACGSTNDTVAVLATGTASQPPDLAAVQAGLDAVCADLAHAVVADGEGTTRVAAITVSGAGSDADAEGLARTVAASALFRAALHGADPNWGRILCAMGTSGVAFDPDRVTISCGGVTVCRFGVATAFDRGQAVTAMERPEVAIEIDCRVGTGAATVLCADLTPRYVADNAYYTT